jgi:hypothetical protein
MGDAGHHAQQQQRNTPQNQDSQQALLTLFEGVPPVTPALGTGGRRQLSSAKWHKDGKQYKQLYLDLEAGPILQDNSLKLINKHTHLLHVTLHLLLLSLCLHLSGPRSTLLPEGACASVPRLVHA